jgi:hypothetical protein
MGPMDDLTKSVSPTVLESATTRLQQHEQDQPPKYFLVDSETGKRYLFVLGSDMNDMDTAVIDDMKKQMTEWKKLGQVQLESHTYDVFE